jgi:glucosamine--fructose-6-phosphate aminotransferase (isomerizing)
MCGIMGAVAQRDVEAILLEGLKRLEYRGYDSSGMAVVDHRGVIQRKRQVGKIAKLENVLRTEPLSGTIGIAHTRWATHGFPSKKNAHPHICYERVAVVHNGIIENYEGLKQNQIEIGYRFTSTTDTEVIVHQIHFYLDQGHDLLKAVKMAVGDLKGSYALGVICSDEPTRLITTRRGSPLVLGLGPDGNFIASDIQALLPLTQQFVFPEDSDIVDVRRDAIHFYDRHLKPVDRQVKLTRLTASAADPGRYRHYMLKEIYEQPEAIAKTLEGRISNGKVRDEILGPEASEILDATKAVQIVACGTSYHAALIAKYWFEGIADIPCQVEVASEFRYRKHVTIPDTLFVTISQSGETADTIAALMLAKGKGYLGSLAICNVPESSLVRESNLVLMTHAGPEIGVASTKAFTTQLVALLLLVVVLGRRHGLDSVEEKRLVKELLSLPELIKKALALDAEVEKLSRHFADKKHALFLGRGSQFPVAMEGALKLKEISYIHAESYPAGELKHGPLALVDSEMPVVAVAPKNGLVEKLRSNLEEVRARGGKLYVIANSGSEFVGGPGVAVLEVAIVDDTIAPIMFTIPLQLLAYHTAVLKGTDVDKPRNLAKSVTVE